MVLLDTCALIWWTLDPGQLSSRAAAVCERIPVDGAFLSTVSIWEIGIKLQKGQLKADGMTVTGYVQRLRRLGCFEFVAPDEDIWAATFDLKWTHRDPVDRVIVATAKRYDLPVVTKDETIRRFYRRSIW